MQFSDTTNKNGIIQECEFWTGQNDGTISGSDTLLKQFANRVNRAYDYVLPLVFSAGDTLRFDDTNHTDFPIATFDIVNGQGAYNLTSDEDGNSILNIIDVQILQSATATQYEKLDRILINTDDARDVLAQNSNNTGVPCAFLENNGTIFFDLTPNYTATDGCKVFFERMPDYFAYSDTTQTPGIPALFHPLLALYASYDWLLVNKPENTALITRIEAKIAQMRSDLQAWIDKQNPTEIRLEIAYPNHL